MSFWRQRFLLAMIVLLLATSLACGLGGDEAPTETPAPTDPPAPTATAAPTETPVPTETPLPTATAVPPTATALPEPTATADTGGADLLTYTSFVDNSGGLSFEFPDGWSIEDLDGFYLWASDEALLMLDSSADLVDGAVGFVEYRPFGPPGFIEMDFGPDPVATLTEFSASEAGREIFGEPLQPLVVKATTINGAPAALAAGETALPDVDQTFRISLVYVAGAEAGVLYFGVAPAGADASYLTAIETIPTTITLEAAGSPLSDVSCTNEDMTAAITHPFNWYSESDNDGIYLAREDYAVGEFVDGITSIFISGGPIEDVDFGDVTSFDDPAAALNEFIASEEVTETFTDLTFVEETTPLIINGLSAARAVLGINVPGIDGDFQLILTFYADEGLFGAMATFIDVENWAEDGPLVEAITNSFTFETADLLPCSHAPVASVGLTPIQPGELVSGLRLDYDVTGAFSFVASGEETVLVVVSAEDGRADLVLDLRDADGLLLDSIDWGLDGDSEFLEFNPVAGQEYFLYVSEYSGERAVYNVALVELGAASPQLLETVSAELSLNDDYAYSWNNVVDEPFLIIVSGPVELDLVLEQISAGGGNAQYSDSGVGGEPELIVVLPVENQDYQFAISEYGGQPGPITIQVYGLQFR